MRIQSKGSPARHRGGPTTCRTRMLLRIAAVLLGALSGGGLVQASEPASAPHGKPMLLLAYDNSGDFGPATPGTRTAGWQEALDACVRQSSDLFVKGGFGGTSAIYHVTETIRFPPAQDFRVDGGVYVVNWEGPADRDLMVIDSAMNCEYHLGLLVYGGKQAALRVRPEKPVPIDGFPVMVESHLELEGLADPHPFTPGPRQGGTGLVLDGTRASIVHSYIALASVINFATCIATEGGVAFNEFKCPHLHSNADGGTLMRITAGTFGNHMLLTIGVDQGAKNVTGVILEGGQNIIDLARRYSNAPFPRGQALVFSETAAGNQVNWTDVETNDLVEAVTDKAKFPSNQITWTGTPLPIRRIAVPAGEFVYTQRLFPATVFIDAGRISRATLVRGSERIDCRRSLRSGILLSVADQLILKASANTRLRVIPFKTR